MSFSACFTSASTYLRFSPSDRLFDKELSKLANWNWNQPKYNRIEILTAQ